VRDGRVAVWVKTLRGQNRYYFARLDAAEKVVVEPLHPFVWKFASFASYAC